MISTKTLTKHLPFFFFTLIYCITAFSQQSFFDFLPENEEPVTINVALNIKEIIKTKKEETYFPTKFSYELNGQHIEIEVKLKARGNIRKEICYYPPMMLKVDKDFLKANNLSDFSKYKLVVNCKGGASNASLVYKEVLAYKLYNEICPISLRAKPIILNFIDQEDPSKTTTLEGFIIENEEELASRIEGIVVNRQKFALALTEKKVALIMSLFQYMIGNTDWALANMHNVKLLKVPEFQKVVPLPYDFDYSGLVNANYAVPHESLNLKSVVERYYMGPKCSEEEWPSISEPFIENKEKVFALINGFKLLADREKDWISKYISGFYEIIEDKKKAGKHFF